MVWADFFIFFFVWTLAGAAEKNPLAFDYYAHGTSLYVLEYDDYKKVRQPSSFDYQPYQPSARLLHR